jgi:hypothetical protein
MWEFKRPSEVTAKLEWVLPELAAKGCFTILTGPPWITKSTLLSQLLNCGLNGGTFLGPVPKFRAFLSPTDHDTLMNYNKDGLLPNPPSNILSKAYILRSRYSLDDWRKKVDDVGNIISRKPIDLLIVDSLNEALPPIDPNSESQVSEALRPLRSLAHHHNIAVLGVRHDQRVDGTDGGYSGAVDWKAMPETWATLTADRTHRNARKLGIDSNLTWPTEWRLTLNAETNEYNAVQIDGPQFH